jgi:GTP-binding protein
LFIDLGANDEQLEFPVVYTSAKSGWASLEADQLTKDMSALLDKIISDIPPPKFNVGTTQMQVTSLDYSSYVGRIGIGRVYRGTLNAEKKYKLVKRNGDIVNADIKQIFTFEGLNRVEQNEIPTGDICAIVGVDDINIGDTIADFDHPEPMPIITIDEPTISMTFTINTSPFFGKEGKYVTSRHLQERLMRELEKDVALRVENTNSPDSYKVSGRGILHLSILMENMRREGYEFAVGQPKVIYKEIDGHKAEPVEELVVDVPGDLSGKVIELVSPRKGTLVSIEDKGTFKNLIFHIPSRGLMGLRNKLLTATGGEAVMNHRFYQYEFFKGSIPGRQNGVIISMGQGPVIAYAVDALQDRGQFLVDTGVDVYAGQVIGIYNKDSDIVVNVQKSKKLTNMRASGSDKAIKIAPPVKMSLEENLEFIAEDELVEVTPKSIRIRKIILDENERKRSEAQKKKIA